MTQPAITKRGANLSSLLLVAALVVFVIAALLGFGVFGSVTVLQLIALFAVGESCCIASCLA